LDRRLDGPQSPSGRGGEEKKCPNKVKGKVKVQSIVVYVLFLTDHNAMEAYG
jgi:hypothetical protein